MKKIFLLLFCLFLNPTSFAETSKSIPQEVSLKINVNYQNNTEKNKFSIHNKVKFAHENHLWIVVPSKQPQSPTAPILLAKVSEQDAMSAKINFLLISPGKNHEIIARPVLITAYNKKAQMIIKDKNTKIEFDVLATL